MKQYMTPAMQTVLVNSKKDIMNGSYELTTDEKGYGTEIDMGSLF